MSARNASLKRRLVLWLLGPMVVLSFLILGHVYYSARQTADDVYDRVLRASALAIAERVVVGENGEIEVDLPYVALEMLTSAAHDRVYYKVDSGSTFVTGYRELPTTAASRSLAAGQTSVYDTAFRGAAIRVVAVAGAASGASKSFPFTVFVAETTQARQNLVSQMLISSAGRLGATIAAALIIVWIGVQWGLRPLTRLEEALGRRSQNDLRPIRHTVPVEVRRLVESINDMMSRLDVAIEALRRFTGNAGHQLRTPLSVIKAQLELAMREDDPDQLRAAIEEARRATQNGERLVEQLLLLAKVDAESSGGSRFEPVDLVSVARETASEFAAESLKRDFDLGFEAQGDPAPMLGSRALISEALANLIQNAMAYCPSGSKITVRTAARAPAFFLEVEDDGPGISAHLRSEAQERFVRLAANGTDGSGLGLAIVQEIAALHGGQLRLHEGPNGKGLRVAMSFPAAEAEGRLEIQPALSE